MSSRCLCEKPYKTLNVGLQKENDVSACVTMHSETANDYAGEYGQGPETSSAADTQCKLRVSAVFLVGPVPAENALRAASEPHITSAEHCIGQIITSSPRQGQSEHENVEEPKAMR